MAVVRFDVHGVFIIGEGRRGEEAARRAGTIWNIRRRFVKRVIRFRRNFFIMYIYIYIRSFLSYSKISRISFELDRMVERNAVRSIVYCIFLSLRSFLSRRRKDDSRKSDEIASKLTTLATLGIKIIRLKLIVLLDLFS